jgi:hypothetical protein
MSTGNHELGAFDRAVQSTASQQRDHSITQAGRVVVSTTAYHWLCRTTS